MKGGFGDFCQKKCSTPNPKKIISYSDFLFLHCTYFQTYITGPRQSVVPEIEIFDEADMWILFCIAGTADVTREKISWKVLVAKVFKKLWVLSCLVALANIEMNSWIREGWRYQIRWIFRKILNGLRPPPPPPSFSENYIAIFFRKRPKKGHIG